MNDAVTTHQAEEDARNDQSLIQESGQVVRKAEAVVSVHDKGVVLGDGQLGPVTERNRGPYLSLIQRECA